MTLAVIGRLFRGTASMKSMSGPLDIAKFSGEAARTGAIPLVALMAAISLQLGIFNLLPIPVLDGGHLFLLSLEGIARRDFSLRVKERILQVGFVMILALLAVVLYNDLAKNVSEKLVAVLRPESPAGTQAVVLSAAEIRLIRRVGNRVRTLVASLLG